MNGAVGPGSHPQVTLALPTLQNRICAASHANGSNAGRHVLVRAIPSRIASSSTSRLMLRSALNLMQYPVTLALPSFPP
jgi:hypothetical protein